MKHYLKCLALLACAMLLAACGAGRVRLGTADIGGKYYAFGEAFAKCVTEKTGKPLEARKTAGSAANLRLLSDGYLELGIAQSDLIADALSGSGLYAGKPRTGYSAISGLYTEACQILVREDSPIYEIDDLFGRPVSIGEAESGTESTAWRILTAYGIARDKVSAVNLDYAKAAAALESRMIDAAFCTAGGAIEAFESLSERVPLRLLSLEGRAASLLLRNNPSFTRVEVPAGLYRGQEKTESLGVRAILLASDRLDAATVKALTEVLYTHEKSLGLELSRDLDLRFHPGAEAYFEDAGLLPADREGTAK